MSIFLTIVIFLAILVVVIIVHEFGHFITAKLSGVKVEELGIGFPPRIIGIKRGETIYSVNLIPLGGFCKMAGEEDPNVPESLAGKSVKTRLLVLSAGCIMMVVLPLFLFPIAYMIPMARPAEDGGIRVISVAEGSPAAEVEIQAEDVIVKVAGEPVSDIGGLQDIVNSHLGSEMTMLLLRDDTDVEVTLVPRQEPPEGEGPIGIALGPVMETRAYPPWKAIPMGLGEYWEMLVLLKNAIVTLIQGQEEFVVAGPIGIGQITGEVAKGGAYSLIRFTAFLSVNLAIINLLPIPALDGGRIALICLEVLRRGKRISPRTEHLINTIGFALIILLIVVVSYYDIIRLIQGRSILP